MKKRIISLLLTVAMLLSVIPVLANADAAVTEPSFKSVSLTLDGILRLNVKVNPGTVTDMSGYKVKFTVGEDAPVECTTPTQQNGLYVYTAKIPAHKLQKAVKVELLTAENEVLGESTWTLDAYLASIVAWDAGLTNLANALKLYSTNAAAYATDSESTAPATAVEQATLVSYKSETELPNTDLAPSAKLLLNDACTIRVQVKGSNWVEGYGLKINGEAKEMAYNDVNDLYYYEIKDIRAQGWGTKYAVEFVDGEGETVYKCNYSAMSYVYTVLGTPENYAKEINLLKSMYLYFAEADNYIKAERFEYGLTYNANYEGSEEAIVDSSTITATSKNYTIAANTFERPGYKFAGWNTKADGTGTAYKVGDTVALPVFDTLTAVNLGELTTIPDSWQYINHGSIKSDKSGWTNAGGALKCDLTTNSQVLRLDTTTADNYEIVANVVMQTSGSIGLVFADNHYFRISYDTSSGFRLYTGYTAENYKTFRTPYGSAITLGAKYGLVAGEAATLKVVVNGATFSIVVNGETAVTNDASALSGDTHGAYAKSNLYGSFGLLQYNGSGDAFGFNDISLRVEERKLNLYAQWEDTAMFSVNFNDKVVSDAWTQYDNNALVTEGSVWSAADGTMKYVGTDASQNSVLMLDTSINADKYEITTQVTMPSGGSIGLIFAANDNLSNFHYFRIWRTGSTYKLYAGHDTSDGLKTLNTGYGNKDKESGWTDIDAGKTVTLKVVVDGQNFSIYANDHLWMSKTTTGTNLHGKIGLFVRAGASATGHSFDDVKVSVPGQLMLEKFNDKVVSDAWTQYDNNALVTEGSVWSAADGTMKYVGTDASQNSALMFNTSIDADKYVITTQVTMPSGGSIGLIFAANDNLSNFHYFRIWRTGSTYKLYAGHDTSDGLKTLNTGYGNKDKESGWTDIDAGKTVTLKVVVDGQNFSIYANDHLWMSQTTTGTNLHGKIGLLVRAGASATGHSFDNVMVVANQTAG